MRALRWFILGAIAGAMLGLVLLASLYLSPWRQWLYLNADPKVAAVREKIHSFQAQIEFNEGRMAFAGDSLESLQASQNRVWKEYSIWRTRLGELSSTHKASSPTHFLAWSQSLVAWVLPGTLLFFFGGGLLALFAVMRHQEKNPIIAPRPRRALEPDAAPQALDQFQEAVRRIADIQSRSPVRQKGRGESPAQVDSPKPATPVSLKASETGVNPVSPQPVAKARSNQPAVQSPWALPQDAQAMPFASAKPTAPAAPVAPAPIQPLPVSLPEGMSVFPPKPLSPEDTAYLDVLSGWEDMAQTAQSEMPPLSSRTASPVVSPSAFLQSSRPPEPAPLTMQDEDSDGGVGPDGNATGDFLADNPYSLGDLSDPDLSYGKMPETTEFEKVERQKEEVVKLARKGMTSSEISRRLKISEDQVELIVRMRRERG